VSAEDAARGLIGALDRQGLPQKNVFACWMGDASLAAGRAALAAAKLPDFETPERAVRAFMYLVRYRQNQALLLETPSASAAAPADIARWCAAHWPMAASGSIPPNARRSSPATACRSRAPRRSPTPRLRQRSLPRS